MVGISSSVPTSTPSSNTQHISCVDKQLQTRTMKSVSKSAQATSSMLEDSPVNPLDCLLPPILPRSSLLWRTFPFFFPEWSFSALALLSSYICLKLLFPSPLSFLATQLHSITIASLRSTLHLNLHLCHLCILYLILYLLLHVLPAQLRTQGLLRMSLWTGSSISWGKISGFIPLYSILTVLHIYLAF